MSKRDRSQSDDDGLADDRVEKRSKLSHSDCMSKLSDELTVRILSFVAASDLLAFQKVSRKYYRVAQDGELWKQQYYNRFVRPRAIRLPGLKQMDNSDAILHFSSEASPWLDDEYLVRQGKATSWKNQFRLRHNWSTGNCAVKEITVAQQAPVAPILAQMQDGIIYTADSAAGLRAWAARGDRKLLASTVFATQDGACLQSPALPPTSLAVDAKDAKDRSTVIVGFEDGSFSVYALWHSESLFQRQYTHRRSPNGALDVAAVKWPFVMVMTTLQVVKLYKFSDGVTRETEGANLERPKLLTTLVSHKERPPLSASLRTSNASLFMCIAFAQSSYRSDWTVGIQEDKYSLDGETQGSRIAVAISQRFRPLALSSHPVAPHLPSAAMISQGALSAPELRHIYAQPTSLSYTHPYLLVSHPDTTLTLYLATSTADSLSISSGTRLWGHTSLVSGAHVGGRGKAVSVSRCGDELRIWELEGGFTSSAARKRLVGRGPSVQIKPGGPGQMATAEQPQSRLDLVHGTSKSVASKSISDAEETSHETSGLTLTRGWVGFDDHNVVFLKEEGQGKQSLVVYDFT